MLETEIALTGQLSTPVPLKGKLNQKYIYPDEQDPTVPQWVKDIKEEDIEKWNEPRVEESDPTVPEWVKNITEEEINKWNNPETPQIEEVDPTVPEYVKNITEEDIAIWTSGRRLNLSKRYDFDIAWNGMWSKMDNVDKTLFENYINKYYDGTNASSLLPLTIAIPAGSSPTSKPYYELTLTNAVYNSGTFSFYGFCYYGGEGFKNIDNAQLFVVGSFTDGYFSVTNVGYRGWKDRPFYLKNNNTTEYTPTNDYNPANKKYVDDTVNNAIATAITGALESEY